MKAFIKYDRYGLSTMRLSDKDNAVIFNNANEAIYFIKKMNDSSDPIKTNYSFFVNSFTTRSECNKNEYNIYHVFNFKSKAAIFIEEIQEKDGDLYKKKSYFFTKNEFSAWCNVFSESE